MATGRSGLPGVWMPSRRVLWWGGLAAVAALGIVDWPVAVLVGAGSWVVERDVAQRRAQESRRQVADRAAEEESS